MQGFSKAYLVMLLQRRELGLGVSGAPSGLTRGKNGT